MAIVHAYLIDLADNRRFLEDVPEWDTDNPTPDNVVLTPMPANTGWIRPRHNDATNAWTEGASQQQLDDRAAFVAEQDLIAAARQRLQTLAAANKSIAGDIETLEQAIVIPLGKAGRSRSLAMRDATLAIRQAYQSWVNSPPAAAGAVAALTALFTAIGTQEEARRQAEIDYLAALQDIADAITDRAGP